MVGYCLGGSYALLMSCQDTGIGAAAAYYGQIVNEEPTEDQPRQPDRDGAPDVMPASFRPRRAG